LQIDNERKRKIEKMSLQTLSKLSKGKWESRRMDRRGLSKGPPLWGGASQKTAIGTNLIKLTGEGRRGTEKKNGLLSKPGWGGGEVKGEKGIGGR